MQALGELFEKKQPWQKLMPSKLMYTETKKLKKKEASRYRADRNLTKVLQKYAMFGRFVHPLRPLIKGFPPISSMILSQRLT